MKRSAFTGSLLLLLAAASTVFALGADFSKAELKNRGVFVEGQVPVHGYWVNWEDIFWYAGDAKAFNQFAEAYGKFKHVKLDVVIHAGTVKASSPWDKAPRDIAADWSLYVWNTGTPFAVKPGEKEPEAPKGKPAPTRIDVWVGQRLPLKDLRIPTNIDVAAAKDVEKGSDIEKFVDERKKAT